MIPNLKQTKPILCVYLPQPCHVAAASAASAAVLPRYHLTNGFWEEPNIGDVCFGNKFHVFYLSVQAMNFSTNMKFHKIGVLTPFIESWFTAQVAYENIARLSLLETFVLTMLQRK
jgi:hypothetical protein